VAQGRLILCATPIGNLGDVSSRLSETLAAADVVFAEDTRRSRKLLQALGIDRPLRSYHRGNEDRQAEMLEGELRAGRVVALLTDAGVPGVSDPGLTAVRAARRAGAGVGVVPGPSAVTAALAVSGIPAGTFFFAGFLPRRGRAREQLLARVAGERGAAVVFVAPHHLGEDLHDLREACGDREICVCRELTKAFEEVWWGRISEAITEWKARPPQGEFTVVISGGAVVAGEIEPAVEAALAAVADGAGMSEAVRETATRHGVSRRLLYEEVLKRRDA
jgi:16S rRNA (cytidine1402-2'-O)-methyltransferase